MMTNEYMNNNELHNFCNLNITWNCYSINIYVEYKRYCNKIMVYSDEKYCLKKMLNLSGFPRKFISVNDKICYHWIGISAICSSTHLSKVLQNFLKFTTTIILFSGRILFDFEFWTVNLFIHHLVNFCEKF